jgi:hypothetical protein
MKSGMPRYKNVECLVDEPSEVFGQFSNAIRLTADGAEVLLDFCLYSTASNRARVVSRVRVHRDFLPTIQSKIGEAVAPLDGDPPVLFIMPPVQGES